MKRREIMVRLVKSQIAALRLPLQSIGDGLAWIFAIWLANAVRFDFHHLAQISADLFAVMLFAAGFQFFFGIGFHLYRGRYRFGSFEEIGGLFAALIATATVLTLVNYYGFDRLLVPRSVPPAAAVMAFVLMSGVRYSWRLVIDRRVRPRHGNGEPVLLFGAGDGADQILASMLRDRGGHYLPVGLIDDDVRKHKLRLRGVPVLGGRKSISLATKSTGASTLLLAIPSASSQLVQEVSAIAKEAGLGFKVVPTLSELMHGTVDVTDIRDPDLADILGRRQIELDLASIAGYIAGKRVLVTGAGGSIGSELCRQLVQFAPAELVMLDRDESALHAVQLATTGRALLDSENLVLADIREIQHMNQVFEDHRPHVVFHAAALKHLTLLERYPGESIKSNVWGTLTVLQAAKAAGVEHFVNISTDKAADPTSVLGYSKRITERLTAHFATQATGKFVSVRFGNVLGSRGSMLPAFTAQIKAGGPITVTHPDVTRFFMTASEAVQLVIQAAAVGETGEVLVLDMGEPVSIDAVARKLADAAPNPTAIVYTGLRPGEKLHEDLLGEDEPDFRPNHPLISQVMVPCLNPVDAQALDPWDSPAGVIESLERLTASAGDRPNVRQGFVLDLTTERSLAVRE